MPQTETTMKTNIPFTWQILFGVVGIVCGSRFNHKPTLHGIYLHGGKKVLVK